MTEPDTQLRNEIALSCKDDGGGGLLRSMRTRRGDLRDFGVYLPVYCQVPHRAVCLPYLLLAPKRWGETLAAGSWPTSDPVRRPMTLRWRGDTSSRAFAAVHGPD